MQTFVSKSLDALFSPRSRGIVEGRLGKPWPALSALQVDQLQEGEAVVLLEEVFKGHVLCKQTPFHLYKVEARSADWLHLLYTSIGYFSYIFNQGSAFW